MSHIESWTETFDLAGREIRQPHQSATPIREESGDGGRESAMEKLEQRAVEILRGDGTRAEKLRRFEALLDLWQETVANLDRIDAATAKGTPSDTAEGFARELLGRPSEADVSEFMSRLSR